jgi:endonuclease I
MEPPMLRTALILVLGAALAPPAWGLDPAGRGDYYAAVVATDPGSLRLTLHALIDDHQRFPYTASTTDTWDILKLAEQDPADSGRIVDVYRNASYIKHPGGNSDYDREHTWPKSYGFPDEGTSSPHTDTHMLMLSHIAYNGARGNKRFEQCATGCGEHPTLATNGSGGGSGSYPGNSNWSSATAFQVWVGKRGDVARAIFYMDVRYEGGSHGGTGTVEPDLRVTDDPGQIQPASNGAAVAYMGLTSVLLAWHEADPPDDFERRRNDVVASFQGNRNPFIDHPEWVACLHLGDCAAAGDALFADGFDAMP